MDSKIDIIVAYDMGATAKNHITLCKNIFPFMKFFSAWELYLFSYIGPLQDYFC